MAQPDMSLISELLEIMDREPPAIEARKILVQQYISVNWMDAARDYFTDLKRLAPNDPEVKAFEDLLKLEKPRKPLKTASANKTPEPLARRQITMREIKPAVLPTDPIQLAKLKQEMIDGFQDLRIKAASLLKMNRIVANVRPSRRETASDKAFAEESHERLQLIAEGKVATAVRQGPSTSTDTAISAGDQPRSVRAVARLTTGKSVEETLRILLLDYESIVAWSRKDSKTSDDDGIRATLVKRSQALKAALPETVQDQPPTALMHMEHEHLKRNYVNDETMLGDTIPEIPREAFFASEDNYAWDMSELAQAISTNSGVMRNPLSREMFSRADIKFIVAHPMGKHLAAMGIEQSQLSKGVRPKTIDEMLKMAKVMLEDQSADQIPTRKAVDEFLGYLATLPEAEQKALDKLNVPARDSHTGQAYDGTIMASLKDALGNRQCFHKTGDFIQQACTHLRRK